MIGRFYVQPIRFYILHHEGKAGFLLNYQGNSGIIYPSFIIIGYILEHINKNETLFIIIRPG